MGKSIEEVLSEVGVYIVKPKGTSMYPMLRLNCDSICVVPASLPLKKHDVALYKRKGGAYVLHRVMEVADEGYVFCGDNQCFTESGVTDDMIVGVLDSWYTGEKKHSVTDKRYLRYVRFWCGSMRRRALILRFCHKFLWRKYKGKSVTR